MKALTLRSAKTVTETTMMVRLRKMKDFRNVVQRRNTHGVLRK
jgi:hypothetical protein